MDKHIKNIEAKRAKRRVNQRIKKKKKFRLDAQEKIMFKKRRIKYVEKMVAEAKVRYDEKRSAQTASPSGQ